MNCMSFLVNKCAIILFTMIQLSINNNLLRREVVSDLCTALVNLYKPLIVTSMNCLPFHDDFESDPTMPTARIPMSHLLESVVEDAVDAELVCFWHHPSHLSQSYKHHLPQAVIVSLAHTVVHTSITAVLPMAGSAGDIKDVL